jgi:hypothetical protein
MVTRITYEGVDSVVELEDKAVTIRGAAATSARSVGDAGAAGAGAAAEDPAVIPRWEVDEATVKPPTLLSYGTLVIVARGREYTVQFSRDAHERFDNLAAVLR